MMTARALSSKTKRLIALFLLVSPLLMTSACKGDKGDKGDPASIDYLDHVALVSQAGTNAPTSSVLHNSLGLTLTWVRDSAGTYRATISPAIDLTRTVIFTNVIPPGGSPFRVYFTSSTSLELDIVGDNWTNVPLEIRTYVSGTI